MEKEEKQLNVTNGFVWTFAERITAQLVSTLVGIVLARLMLPQEYAAQSILNDYITQTKQYHTKANPTSKKQKKYTKPPYFNPNLKNPSQFFILPLRKKLGGPPRSPLGGAPESVRKDFR